jgi:hypothetical protein
MSDAPEKVWVSVECDDDGGYLELMPEDAASPDFDTEYTRSDLCITRAEADAMVAAERERCAKLAKDCKAAAFALRNAASAIRKGETP